MLCLGIETSCDDTSLALVEDGMLLGCVTASQVDLHTLFGGVVPELASREHGRMIGKLYDHLLQITGKLSSDIDAVAVTRGPGLLGCLLVGVAFAKGLALAGNLPVIGVNHLQAHVLACGLEQPLVFPSVALLVSGGHTHLYYLEDSFNFHLLGRTIDDAAGEAFDKAGKMLGLPYPAGKYIDELSKQGIADPTLFPRPYLNNESLDFSFSGLKTAISTFLTKQNFSPVGWSANDGKIFFRDPHQEQYIADICASYTMAIIDVLKTKTAEALRRNPTARTLVLAGGVACNSALRRALAELAVDFQIPLVVPSPALCSDNGAMIAYAGSLLLARGARHHLDFTAVPRGRTLPNDYVF